MSLAQRKTGRREVLNSGRVVVGDVVGDVEGVAVGDYNQKTNFEIVVIKSLL